MNIYQKIIELKSRVGGFERDSTAPGMKYKYVGGTQVFERINPAMIALQLLFILKGATSDEWTKHEYDTRNGHKIDFIVRGRLFYQFINAENPEEKIDIEFIYYGQQDEISKAFGSGLTYSERYMILKFLGLPTDSDDPDAKPQIELTQAPYTRPTAQTDNSAPKQQNAPTTPQNAPKPQSAPVVTKTADDIASEIKASNAAIMKARISPAIESAVAKALADGRIEQPTADTLRQTLAKAFFTKHLKFPLNADGKLSGFELAYEPRNAYDNKNVVVVTDQTFMANLAAFVEAEIAASELPF